MSIHLYIPKPIKIISIEALYSEDSEDDCDCDCKIEEKPKNINDALANALSKDFSGVRISKVSWEISETLVDNPEVKRYLMIAGKSIKNTLAQDLMSATEPSFKENIIVNITYRKDGSVAKTTIEGSSGSKEIDDIVLKSLRETFNYVKMPPLNINKPEYTAKLIIRL